jgi:hypothetical protein
MFTQGQPQFFDTDEMRFRVRAIVNLPPGASGIAQPVTSTVDKHCVYSPTN